MTAQKWILGKTSNKIKRHTPKRKGASMTLFDKISTLETTFTTAKDDLQALQQSVQAHLESFVQESLETTKDKAKEFFTKELETTAQTLNAQNMTQVQELFSKNLHTLAQEALSLIAKYKP